MAPIIWSSRRQNTAEASIFGAEFVAMRTMYEMLLGLRYKLLMFGIPIDGPRNTFYNEEVTKSSINPHATLKEKKIFIALHQAREAVAGIIALIFYEKTKSNHADFFTKFLNHIYRKLLTGYIYGKTKE